MSAAQLLKQIEAAVLELKGPEAVAWIKAYLDKGGDRDALVQQLAVLACLMGNDPHNQEIGNTLLEDYERNRSSGSRAFPARSGASHRDVAQIRQPAGLGSPFRQRDGDCRSAIADDTARRASLMYDRE